MAEKNKRAKMSEDSEFRGRRRPKLHRASYFVGNVSLRAETSRKFAEHISRFAIQHHEHDAFEDDHGIEPAHNDTDHACRSLFEAGVSRFAEPASMRHRIVLEPSESR